MGYNLNNLLPYIPPTDYDKVATEFLEKYYSDALYKPLAVPILEIAKNKMGLDVQFICLSEEVDIYGMTIFDDGFVEYYDPIDGVYETKIFKKKTVLIDPDAVKKTNSGSMNNTIAHECVHWFKHRMYYKMQKYTMPRQAKYCKCRMLQLPYLTEEENIMESQAIGIAPRILMPKNQFEEMAGRLKIKVGQDNREQIACLADIFQVSKQSVSIRLEECGII